MSNRSDLNDAAGAVQTIYQIGVVFSENVRDWSHLKNNEDFNQIYSLSDTLRIPMEQIYNRGRQFAGDISEHTNTIWFRAGEYPTVTSIVERMERYVACAPELDETLENGKLAINIAGLHRNFAMSQMVDVFTRQLASLGQISLQINMLKSSDQYKRENGLPTSSLGNNYNFNNASNINVAHGNNITQTNSTNNELNSVLAQMLAAAEASNISDKAELIALIDELKNSPKPLSEKLGNFFVKSTKFLAVVGPFIAELGGLIAG